MKKRFLSVVSIALIILVCGIAYALLCNTLGFGIPCFFRLTTGLKCPGCGITGMFLSIMRLDFDGAFKSNPAMLLSFPAIMVLFADVAISYIKTGKCATKRWSAVLMWIVIIGLIVFGIVRNFI